MARSVTPWSSWQLAHLGFLGDHRTPHDWVLTVVVRPFFVLLLVSVPPNSCQQEGRAFWCITC